MTLSRRELLKTLAGTGAAVLTLPDALFAIPEGVAEAAETAEEWKKSPCRFCGVGCGALVGLRQGKVVAVKGDPEAPVNRGLLCIKGYSLPRFYTVLTAIGCRCSAKATSLSRSLGTRRWISWRPSLKRPFKNMVRSQWRCTSRVKQRSLKATPLTN